MVFSLGPFGSVCKISRFVPMLVYVWWVLNMCSAKFDFINVLKVLFVQYEVYKHYKQFPTNKLNDHLHYKTHTLFDTITHASYTNISAIPTTMNRKWTSLQPVPLGPPSSENGTYGTEKLLLKFKWVKILHSEVNLIIHPRMCFSLGRSG